MIVSGTAGGGVVSRTAGVWRDGSRRTICSAARAGRVASTSTIRRKSGVVSDVKCARRWAVIAGDSGKRSWEERRRMYRWVVGERGRTRSWDVKRDSDELAIG